MTSSPKTFLIVDPINTKLSESEGVIGAGSNPGVPFAPRTISSLTRLPFVVPAMKPEAVSLKAMYSKPSL